MTATLLKKSYTGRSTENWRCPISSEPSSPSPGWAGRLRAIVGNAVELSFTSRERRFYDLFEQQAATLVRSASLLEEALADTVVLPKRQKEIKDLEHQGDETTHEIIRALNQTFVTPFDREDIYTLAAGMDDILDYIEEVADTTNLYRISGIPGPVLELARLIAQAVVQIEQAIGKLEVGKGGEENVIEVHRLEDLGDSISRRAIAELFSGQHPALEVIKLKDLYGLLEDALDRCEQVANVLEGIAIKNA